MMTFPVEVRALRVQQPLSTFYIITLPARLLLQVAFSDVLSATLKPDAAGYTLEGTQRLSQPKRLSQIADYIDREDAAFPNAIILAANFRPDGLIEDEDEDEEKVEDDLVAPKGGGTTGQTTKTSASREWTVSEQADGCFTLRIPTADKLAAVIDGQHRLFAFTQATVPGRLDMEMICAVFLDLPRPFQAQLFATINSTQKPVDKSLTYELFGYNISEETAEFWTPDKLAVFLTRKLNTDANCPLRGRILVAPKRDAALMALNAQADWRVSTAVVVEGILRLISSNPKRDTNEMLTPESKERRSLEERFRDKSPLREVYLSVNDTLLYTIVLNFLQACESVFWSKATPNSFIQKTVGVQALFDILRKLSLPAYVAKDIRVQRFTENLAPAGNIDFAAEEFRNASGSGRSAIRRAIEARIGI